MFEELRNSFEMIGKEGSYGLAHLLEIVVLVGYRFRIFGFNQ
jgi:hypothetical protein